MRAFIRSVLMAAVLLFIPISAEAAAFDVQFHVFQQGNVWFGEVWYGGKLYWSAGISPFDAEAALPAMTKMPDRTTMVLTPSFENGFFTFKLHS